MRIRLLSALLFAVVGPPAAAQTPAPVSLFVSSTPVADMRGRQAVVETTAGTFVIDLLADAAPNHVALFMKAADEGAYVGTIFHNVVRHAVIQGGDPLTRDPANVDDYGQGGFRRVAAEPNDERHTAGAVSAVRIPGEPDSGGAQFFVSVTNQPALDDQYTVFGRVTDGFDVIQRISEADVDPSGRPLIRIEITAVTIREKPPEPFVDADATELSTRRVVIDTTLGTMTLAMLADRAPETVRTFLRRAHAGLYDGVLIHRVSPNFVIQTGALGYRQTPLTPRQQALVHNLAPEFSETANEPGVVSMARGEDPGSASTSFFICTGQCSSLDGQYTAFARVVEGLDVLDRIASVAVDGETPLSPILVTRIHVEGF